MRCPSCGARNAAGAAWCTQCFADLRSPAAAPQPSPEPEPAAGQTELPPAAPAPPATPTSRPDGAAADVRTVDGEVEWRCSRCGRWTPLVQARCLTCDAPRTGFGEPATPTARPDTSATVLALSSLAVPGLGHLLAGRVGSAIVRTVLGLTWAIGGIAIARAAGRSGASVLPSVPLLLGAVVVWAGSVRDAAALPAGRPELLRPRVLSFLTAGVLGTLVLALVVAATSPAVTG